MKNEGPATSYMAADVQRYSGTVGWQYPEHKCDNIFIISVKRLKWEKSIRFDFPM